MKKCSACGNLSKEDVAQCPYCGSNNFVLENNMAMPQGQPVMNQQPVQQQPMMNQQPMQQQSMMNQQPMQQQPMMNQQPMMGQQMPMGQQPMPGPAVPQASQAKGNIAWGILGFLIPIVGWILYFVWKNSKPADAKIAGIGGIIGFCFNLFIQIIF